MDEQDKLPTDADGVSRRTLLKVAAVGALGAAAGAGGSAALTHLPQAPPRRYRFFTDAEAALLIPICEQIIPADDTPGATDAGVIHYIDRQLVGPLARHQDMYRRGLESFRKTCLEVYDKPFEQLDFDQQTEALRLIEKGEAPERLWGDDSSKEFFNLVIDHTMQGFYGSPRHGGNRDYVSYRMLGLACPNLIGQNRYGTRPHG
jgi:gluconate 2-dehydrogenase gamma chain